MPLDRKAALARLKQFDFPGLFTQELGWDTCAGSEPIAVREHVFELRSVAEKRGVQVFVCLPGDDGRIPPADVRALIDRQVAKRAHEHLLIFTNEARTEQLWLYPRRDPRKPIRLIPYRFDVRKPNELLLQKLEAISCTLLEEERLTLPDVAQRLKEALDRDRLTRSFYQRFARERDAFQKLIDGIPDKDLESWYVAVLINRLMFVYFIQEKGFLDGNQRYLQSRLEGFRGDYYRDFLCPLFFMGFALQEVDRPASVRKLLGRIPYLNGGIFQKHEIEERHGKAIRVPHKAFKGLFDFFDQYRWHLDERPLAAGDEINPEVLGYIFEKYINQKQMGAYYTKEDITGYISQNTVIPFLFDAAKPKCKVAFENPNGPTIWDLLSEEPDRYIYPAVRHGASEPLPDDVAAGVNPPTLHQPVGDGPVLTLESRKGWNKPAPATHALPTETWREVITRRKRYDEVTAKLVAGEVRDINDLITLNLDIRQLAQDVIEKCEGPELLRSFWQAVEKVTILDPTCGSGAFLFAALNILEPLYEACLDRMEAFLDDEAARIESAKLKRTKHGYPLLPRRKFKDFSEVLDRVAEHPNRPYFIFKSIILNNLYGVDIMEEAVEICKLRLFLKLAAQVEPDAAKDNLGIEPLPDIDFNIRAGNTLIGFASKAEVRKAVTSERAGRAEQGRLVLDDAMDRIEENAELADRAWQLFRHMQTEKGMEAKDFAHAKETLRERLNALDDELNRYLATECGVEPAKKGAYGKWLRSHQPFHWFVEFYGIMNGGGFHVIIGNPPYLERRQIDYDLRDYACLENGAVHAMCIERSTQLLHEHGCMSMIVPLALPSTQRMKIVQDILEEGRSAWYANFAWRPGKLFDTVNRALTVFVITPAAEKHTHATRYEKWTSDDRAGLFDRTRYVEVPRERPAFWVPKLGDGLERSILEKVLGVRTTLARFIGETEHRIYYRTTGGLYWKVFTDFPPAFRVNGKTGRSSRETSFAATERVYVKPLVAALSSDVFWWWYTVSSNLRDLNPSDIQNFPLPGSALDDAELHELGHRYLKDVEKNSSMLVRMQKQTGKTETQSFKIQKSKPIIDEIDTALAPHYGFTEEELDFIINYDIKYRMGLDAEGEED